MLIAELTGYALPDVPESRSDESLDLVDEVIYCTMAIFPKKENQRLVKVMPE
jgi:hypothetical protein